MKEQRHIASLDGLRGVAAAAVVISHIPLVFPTAKWIVIADLGSNAVAIFFTLSGFLMAYLYGSRPISRKAGADFLVSRFARIYPVYIAAVLLIVLLSALHGLGYIEPISGIGQIVRHIALLGSTGVFWSVPPEIQFYLMFPVIWLFFSDPRRYQNVGIAIATFLSVDALFDFPGSGILLTSKIHYFLFGTLGGYLHRRWGSAPPSILIGVLSLALPMFILSYRELFPAMLGSLWGMATAFAATLAVSLVAREHPISSAIFASPAIRFLGAISFSLYLLHMPVLFLCQNILGDVLPTGIVLAISLIAALWTACVSYYLIELPCRAGLVNYWRSRSLNWSWFQVPRTDATDLMGSK